MFPRLVNPSHELYDPSMLKPCQWMLAFVLSCLSVWGAELLQLKENAAVMGKILTEKPDQVVVDLGYTVLVVPRSQIVNITTIEAGAGPALQKPKARQAPNGEEEGEEDAAAAPLASHAHEHPGLFDNGIAPARTARAPVEVGQPSR